MTEQIQNVMAFMGLPSGSEWIIVLIVAVLLFGRRLPEIARGMGKSLTEFKKGVKEGQEEISKTIDEVDEGPAESSNKTEKNVNTD